MVVLPLLLLFLPLSGGLRTARGGRCVQTYMTLRMRTPIWSPFRCFIPQGRGFSSGVIAQREDLSLPRHRQGLAMFGRPHVVSENETNSGEEEDLKLETPKRRRGRPPGTKLNAETRRKISEARKGKKWDSATREKMSRSKLGRTHSSETIEKMSESHRGKRLGNETRAKMSERRQGRLHSKEVKERIGKSIAQTIRKKKLMRQQLRGHMEAFARPTRDPEKGKRALAEMKILREQMNPWIRHYKKMYGRNPTLESTRNEFPSLHENMARYNELVRIARANLPQDNGFSGPS